MKPMPRPPVEPVQDLPTQRFEACRNIATGAVFIIASGASAKSFPLAQFAHVPMITMNGAISMFLNSDVRPYFYTCTDKSFSQQQPELFNHAMAISQRIALWEDHAQSTTIPPSGALYTLTKAKKPSWIDSALGRHSALVANHSLRSIGERPIGFSKDMSHGFFDARTVAYLAVQLAFHLGFNRVFLVGVDLDENAGRFYETPESSHSPCGLDQHFETRILPSFKLMSEKVVGDDFRVYNLSDASRLPEDVVPYVTLAEVEGMLG